jgi:hypothetical protein
MQRNGGIINLRVIWAPGTSAWKANADNERVSNEYIRTYYTMYTGYERATHCLCRYSTNTYVYTFIALKFLFR